MVREGGQLDLGAYTADVPWRPAFTKTANVPRVLEEWQAGATIVLQALHVNWHPLAVFCRLLEDAIGQTVQANSYYTPHGSQGFAVHHDTHDVLVLQVAGAKRGSSTTPLRAAVKQSDSKALGEHGEPSRFVLLRRHALLPRRLHGRDSDRIAAPHDRDHAYPGWMRQGRARKKEQELAFLHGIEPGAGERTASPSAWARADPEPSRSAGGASSSNGGPSRGRPLPAPRARRLDGETELERARRRSRPRRGRDG